MKLRKSVFSLALIAALGLGISGQAGAYIYGGGSLSTNNLVINLPGGAAGTEIDSFSFGIIQTAAMNGGSSAVDITNCFSTGTPVTTNNTCSNSGNTLDANVANAPGPGSTFSRGENIFTRIGFGNVGESASADAAILTAALNADAFTSTAQASESEIVSGSVAQSNAEIQSVTGFTIGFFVSVAGDLTIDFDAAVDLLAKADDPNVNTAGASSDFTFTLSQDNGNGTWTWESDGTSGAGCGGNLGCQDTDPFALQDNVGVSTVNTDAKSGGGSYTAGTSGTALQVGDIYTLTLFSKVSSIVTRSPDAIPEPGTLLLLGTGIIAAGAARRRKKRTRS